MNLISSGDELVSRVTLYSSRHPALHGYSSPFILLYLAWLYTWLGVSVSLSQILSYNYEK